MALVSGVGGLPFFFVGKMTGTMAGYANSLACGVMLSASFNLIYDGKCQQQQQLLCLYSTAS